MLTSKIVSLKHVLIKKKKKFETRRTSFQKSSEWSCLAKIRGKKKKDRIFYVTL